MLRTFLQNIRNTILKRQNEVVHFKFELGTSFHPETGFLKRNIRNVWQTFVFIR